MITVEDVEDMSMLTRAEIEALAEHENTNTLNATLMGEYLMQLHHGPQIVHEIICDDIRSALKSGQLEHARELFGVLRNFLAEHPDAARGAS